MPFQYIQKLPSADEVISEMPLGVKLSRIKQQRDQEIKAVFEGRSNKLLLIIGPCSAENEDPVCEYVTRLSRLQEEVTEKIILIPRVYTNKPRTTGVGYKGMMHQPDPMKTPDISEGILAVRRLHVRLLSESHLPAADEMLYPANYPYLEDLLSYVAIGARSVENQQHRLTISGLDVPAGMKNPTSGDLAVMLNSVHAAQNPHVFIYNGFEVSTPGNPLTHAILRGSVDPWGRNTPNYHYEQLSILNDLYRQRELANPAVIIDTNHANSGKKYREQPRIALDVLRSRGYNPEVSELIKGFMIESYLEEGAQPANGGKYGCSITDPCLGWEDTRRLVLELAENL